MPAAAIFYKHHKVITLAVWYQQVLFKIGNAAIVVRYFKHWVARNAIGFKVILRDHRLSAECLHITKLKYISSTGFSLRLKPTDKDSLQLSGCLSHIKKHTSHISKKRYFCAL